MRNRKKIKPSTRQLSLSSEIFRASSLVFIENEIVFDEKKVFCVKANCSKDLRNASVFLSRKIDQDGSENYKIITNKEIEKIIIKELVKNVELRYIPKISLFISQ